MHPDVVATFSFKFFTDEVVPKGEAVPLLPVPCKAFWQITSDQPLGHL